MTIEKRVQRLEELAEAQRELLLALSNSVDVSSQTIRDIIAVVHRLGNKYRNIEGEAWKRHV